MKIKSIGSLVAVILLTTSCTTYYLTTDSLRRQFANIDSTRLTMVTVQGPGFGQSQYLANPIDEIDCVDKNGVPSKLTNSPSIEMRVTRANGKRAIFYFDRIMVTDSTLYGVQSRFIPSIRKTIKLNDIKKIEIQDGKKNYYYVAKQ